MNAFEVAAAKDYSVIARDEDIVPAAGEVVVAVHAAGICGSDMHIVHGDNAFVTYPRVPGHEFSGTISAVGDGVDASRRGERVCVDPVIACGTCIACRRGRSNVCANMTVIGVHRDGGFQARVAVPADNAFRLPESIGLSAGALVEPYTIAANVLRRMQAEPGQRLLVFGAGVIGLTIVQMARAWGLEDIAVTDLVDARLAAAESLGASATVNGARDDVETFAAQWSEGEGVPLVADAACVPALLPVMVRLAAPSGCIGLLGFSSAPSELVQLEVIRKELTLVGSRLNNRRFPAVLELMAAGRLDAEALISHRVALARMPAAVQLLEEAPDQARKILVAISDDARAEGLLEAGLGPS